MSSSSSSSSLVDSSDNMENDDNSKHQLENVPHVGRNEYCPLIQCFDRTYITNLCRRGRKFIQGSYVNMPKLNGTKETKKEYYALLTNDVIVLARTKQRRKGPRVGSNDVLQWKLSTVLSNANGSELVLRGPTPSELKASESAGDNVQSGGTHQGGVSFTEHGIDNDRVSESCGSYTVESRTATAASLPGDELLGDDGVHGFHAEEHDTSSNDNQNHSIGSFILTFETREECLSFESSIQASQAQQRKRIDGRARGFSEETARSEQNRIQSQSQSQSQNREQRSSSNFSQGSSRRGSDPNESCHGSDPSMHSNAADSAVISDMFDQLISDAKAAASSQPHVSTCLEVMKEIWVTEVSYVSDLGVLEQEYMTRIGKAREINPEITSKENHNTISSLLDCIRMIRPINQLRLLTPLQNALVEVGGGDTNPTPAQVAQVYANVFNKKAINQLEPYHTYCNQYPTVIGKITELRKPAGCEFDSLLSSIESIARLQQHGLQSLLIRPAQRICKYPILFQAFTENFKGAYPSDHYTLWRDIHTAWGRLRDVTAKVNERVAKSERSTQMKDVYESLGGDSGCPGLLQPSRTFVAMQDVNMLQLGNAQIAQLPVFKTGMSAAQGKHGRLYVFSDMLIVAVEDGAKSGKFRMILPCYVDLCYAKRGPTPSAQELNEDTQFVLFCPKGISIYVSCTKAAAAEDIVRNLGIAGAKISDRKQKLEAEGKTLHRSPLPSLPEKASKRSASPLRSLQMSLSRGRSASTSRDTDEQNSGGAGGIGNGNGRSRSASRSRTSPLRGRFTSPLRRARSSETEGSDSATTTAMGTPQNGNSATNSFSSSTGAPLTTPNSKARQARGIIPFRTMRKTESSHTANGSLDTPAKLATTTTATPVKACHIPGLAPGAPASESAGSHEPGHILSLHLLRQNPNSSWGEDDDGGQIPSRENADGDKVGIRSQDEMYDVKITTLENLQVVESNDSNDSNNSSSTFGRVIVIPQPGNRDLDLATNQSFVGYFLEAIAGKIPPENAAAANEEISAALNASEDGTIFITLRRPPQGSIPETNRCSVARLSELKQIYDETTQVLKLPIPQVLEELEKFAKTAMADNSKSSHGEFFISCFTTIKAQQKYVMDLRALLGAYMIPLREDMAVAGNDSSMCSPSTFDAIFENIALLTLLDAAILERMVRELLPITGATTHIIHASTAPNGTSNNSSSGLGGNQLPQHGIVSRCFAVAYHSHLPLLLNHYRSFTGSGMEELWKERHQNGAFDQFLTDRERELGSKADPIYMLIQAPLRHLHETSKCIGRIIAGLPRNDTVHSSTNRHVLDLHDAQRRIQSMVSGKTSNSHNVQTLNRIEKVLRAYVELGCEHGLPGFFEPSRRLLKRSEIVLRESATNFSESKSRRLYLFEDALIIGKKMSKKRRSSFGTTVGGSSSNTVSGHQGPKGAGVVTTGSTKGPSLNGGGAGGLTEQYGSSNSVNTSATPTGASAPHTMTTPGKNRGFKHFPPYGEDLSGSATTNEKTSKLRGGLLLKSSTGDDFHHGATHVAILTADLWDCSITMRGANLAVDDSGRNGLEVRIGSNQPGASGGSSKLLQIWAEGETITELRNRISAARVPNSSVQEKRLKVLSPGSNNKKNSTLQNTDNVLKETNPKKLLLKESNSQNVNSGHDHFPPDSTEKEKEKEKEKGKEKEKKKKVNLPNTAIILDENDENDENQHPSQNNNNNNNNSRPLTGRHVHTPTRTQPRAQTTQDPRSNSRVRNVNERTHTNVVTLTASENAAPPNGQRDRGQQVQMQEEHGHRGRSTSNAGNPPPQNRRRAVGGGGQGGFGIESTNQSASHTETQGPSPNPRQQNN